MLKKLTIVIPAKDPKFPEEFKRRNKTYLKKYPVIVINSGKDNSLEEIASLFFSKNYSMAEARVFGYSKVETPYVLNLDSDVIIPKGYITKAIKLLDKEKDVAAVSIFYEDIGPLGALEFGISIWRTEILKELYDYNPRKFKRKIVEVSPGHFTELQQERAEHIYMWKKIFSKGMKLKTLPYKAKHLKEGKI